MTIAATPAVMNPVPVFENVNLFETNVASRDGAPDAFGQLGASTDFDSILRRAALQSARSSLTTRQLS